MTPQFGRLHAALQTRRQMTLLTVVAWLGLLLSVLVLLFSVVQGRYDRVQKEAVFALRELAPSLRQVSIDALQGETGALVELVAIQSEFERYRLALLTSPMPSYFSGLDGYFKNVELSALSDTWMATTDAVQPLLEHKFVLRLLAQANQAMAEDQQALQVAYAELAQWLADEAALSSSLLVERQAWRLQKLQLLLTQLSVASADTGSRIDQLQQSLESYQQLMRALQTGDQTQNIAALAEGVPANILAEIDQLDDSIEMAVEQLLSSRLNLITAEQAARQIQQNAQLLSEQALALPDQAKTLTVYGVQIDFAWALVLLSLTVVLVLTMAVMARRSTNRSLRAIELANQRQQNAILHLLDELAVLAEGDLSARMSVSGEFTGTIAEAINCSIEQIAHRVSVIQSAAEESTQAAIEVQTMTQHLAEASRRQAEEIAAVAIAVKHDALSAEQLQQSAQDTVSAATLSMNAIHQGFAAVQESIEDLDQLLPKLDNSALGAKQLARSINKIGVIVSDINELAEQSNILAVNASIQSSVADNAGRGFDAIAEQIQRLAERSSQTTKQIGTLVSSIQNDTEETAKAMSDSSDAVERGVHLVKDSGAIFDEIEQVSARLVELTDNIAKATVQQASSAGHVSTTMDVIEEIASQTSIGTKTTAESAAKVLRRCKKLHQTIDRLKLASESSQSEVQTPLISDVSVNEQHTDGLPGVD